MTKNNRQNSPNYYDNEFMDNPNSDYEEGKTRQRLNNWSTQANKSLNEEIRNEYVHLNRNSGDDYFTASQESKVGNAERIRKQDESAFNTLSTSNESVTFVSSGLSASDSGQDSINPTNLSNTSGNMLYSTETLKTSEDGFGNGTAAGLSTSTQSNDYNQITLVDDRGNVAELSVGESIGLSNGMILTYDVDDAGNPMILSDNLDGTDLKTSTSSLEPVVAEDVDESGNITYVLNVNNSTNELKSSISNISDVSNVANNNTQNAGIQNVGNLKTGNGVEGKASGKIEMLKNASTQKKAEKTAIVSVKGATIISGASTSGLKANAYDGTDAEFGHIKAKEDINKVANAAWRSKPANKVKTKVKKGAVNGVAFILDKTGIKKFTNSMAGAIKKGHNKFLENKVYGGTAKVFGKVGGFIGKGTGFIRKGLSFLKIVKAKLIKTVVIVGGAALVILTFISMCACIISMIKSTLFFWVEDNTKFQAMIAYVEEINESVDKLRTNWSNNGIVPETGEKISASLGSIVSNSASNINSYIEQGGSYKDGVIHFENADLKVFSANGIQKVSVETGVNGEDGKYLDASIYGNDHNGDYSNMYIDVKQADSQYYGNLKGINWKAFWTLVQVYEVGEDTQSATKEHTDEIFNFSRKQPYGNYKTSWSTTSGEYAINRWVKSNVSADINYTLFINGKGQEVDEEDYKKWKEDLKKYNQGLVVVNKRMKYENKIKEIYATYANCGDNLYNNFKNGYGNCRGAYAYIYGYTSSSAMNTILNTYYNNYENLTDEQYRKDLGLKSGEKSDISAATYASRMVNRRTTKRSEETFISKVKEKYENNDLNTWCKDLNLKDTYGALYTNGANEKVSKYEAFGNKNPNIAENRIYPAYRIDYSLYDDGVQTLDSYISFMQNQYNKKVKMKDENGNVVKDNNGQPVYDTVPVELTKEEKGLVNDLYYNTETAFDAFPAELKAKMEAYCNIGAFEFMAMSSGGYPVSADDQIKYVAAVQVILNADKFNVKPGDEGYMYPGVTIAHAMQETGIGTSKVSNLAINASNLFGMKYTQNGWGGLVVGSYHGNSADWAQFASWDTCIEGRQSTLNSKAGYVNIKKAKTADAQITALSKSDWCEGGYNTLNNLYTKYGMKYDNLSYDEAKEFLEKHEISVGDIVALAQTRLGCQYVWGASHSAAAVMNPNTMVFDCSSFVSWLYYQTGNPLPGTVLTSGIIGNLINQPGYMMVPISAAQPGDILWKSGHVGIYAGNGQSIEAMGSAYGVRMGNAMRYSYAIRKIA